MRKSLLFAAFAMLAVSGFADELLDEVLRWDRPATWTAQGAPSSKVQPAGGASTVVPATPAPARREGDEWLMRTLRDAEGLEGQMDAALLVDEASEKVTGTGAMEGNKEEAFDDGSVGGMEHSSRVAIFGGGGKNEGVVAAVEWTQPLGHTVFDLYLRGMDITGTYQKRHWTRHRRNYRDDYWMSTEEFEGYGGEALVLWRPFRGKVLSPFGGIGGRFGGEKIWEEDADEEKEMSLCGRGGLSVNLGWFSLRGEIRVSQLSWEGLGGGTFRLGRHVALSVFGHYYESNKLDSKEFHWGSACCGGTWIF